MARQHVVLVTLLLAACAGDDDAALRAEASSYRQFTKVNPQPFRTAQHQGNSMVNVWTNELATAPYLQLNATPPAQPLAFPVGAMVVKEMLAADGSPEILTVMAKQPPGYDPTNGDWWFARLDSNANATRSDFVGRVGFCIACHNGAAGDHLFGVP